MNELATVVVIVAGLIYISERFAEYFAFREAASNLKAKQLIMRELTAARNTIEVDFELWWDETGQKATEQAVLLSFMEEDGAQGLPPNSLLQAVIQHNTIHLKSSIFSVAVHQHYTELLEKKGSIRSFRKRQARSFRTQWHEACEEATELQNEIERLGAPLYEPTWK